jgi:hypothetical protein
MHSILDLPRGLHAARGPDKQRHEHASSGIASGHPPVATALADLNVKWAAPQGITSGPSFLRNVYNSLRNHD